jgi:hypothetical protein
MLTESHDEEQIIERVAALDIDSVPWSGVIRIGEPSGS